MAGLFAGIMTPFQSIYAQWYLRKWSKKTDFDKNGYYNVKRTYSFVTGTKYVDLYWTIRDTKHRHNSPGHWDSITLYDRVLVNRVKPGIRRVECGELKQTKKEIMAKAHESGVKY